MEIGIDSFAAILPDPQTGKISSATERMADLLEEVQVADQAGLDVFGIGEHHRAEFLDSAPTIILAAAAARTERIRLTSDLYREVGARAGHSPEKLTVGVHAMGFVGETDAEARDAFFPGWAHLTGSIGRERGWSPPTRDQFDDMAGPEGAFLVGSPATVAAKMLSASDVLGGVSRMTFQMSTASLDTEAMKRSIKLLGTEVAPIVRVAKRAESN
jgi:alkanesulfonate monooxygenase SsuD/methylene tetrahydromethanopterin reductase-like flavin-dependent oxidoreductase (luciferase family)